MYEFPFRFSQWHCRIHREVLLRNKRINFAWESDPKIQKRERKVWPKATKHTTLRRLPSRSHGFRVCARSNQDARAKARRYKFGARLLRRFGTKMLSRDWWLVSEPFSGSDWVKYVSFLPREDLQCHEFIGANFPHDRVRGICDRQRNLGTAVWGKR